MMIYLPLLFFIGLVNCSSEARYKCTNTSSIQPNTIEMEFFFLINDGDSRISRAYGFPADSTVPDVYSGSNTNCNSTGDGFTIGFQVKEMLDISQNVLSSECGIIKIDDVPAYKMRVLLTDISYKVLYTYEFICDLNSLTGVYVSSPVVYEPLRQIHLQSRRQSVSLRFIGADDDLPKQEAQIGERVKLQVLYDRSGYQNVKDTVGTEFWIGIVGRRYYANNMTVKIKALSSSSAKETVNIIDKNGIIETFQINHSEYIEKFIPSYITDFNSDGLKINSTGNIQVIASITSNNQIEMFTIFPTEALWKEYVLVTDNVNSSFVVVATSDDTRVNITSTCDFIINGTTYSKGDNMPTLFLNMYETLHFLATGDCSGTVLLTNINVAVFMGEISEDLKMGQVPGIKALGKSFILFPDSCSCIAKCVALTNTSVTIPDTSSYSDITKYVDQLDIFYANSSDTEYIEIVSSESPLLCIHSSDISSFLIPTSQWSSNYKFHKDDTLAYTLNMVVKTGDETDVLLNGNPISTTWKNVISPNGVNISYSGTQVEIDSEVGIISVNSVDSTKTFMALLTVQNATSAETFAVPGFRLSDVYYPQGCVTTVGHRGDGVDNDCDGQVDEDYNDISASNSFFPDLAFGVVENLDPVLAKVLECVAKPDLNWDNVENTSPIISSMCPVVGPLSPTSPFKLVSNKTSHPQLYNTGVIEMARFTSYPHVFVRCKVDFCTFDGDLTCIDPEPFFCARKKREVSKLSPDNVEVIGVIRITNNNKSVPIRELSKEDCNENIYRVVLAVLIICILINLAFVTYLILTIRKLQSKRSSMK